MQEVAEILCRGRSTSQMISEEKYDAIIRHLKNPKEQIDSNFKTYIKKKKFALLDIPGINLYGVLVVPKPSSSSQGEDFLRVVHKNIIYDIIKQIHVDQLKHAGYKKVLHYVSKFCFFFTFMIFQSRFT